MPEIKETVTDVQETRKSKSRKHRIFIEVALLSFSLLMLSALVIKHIC